VRARATDVDTGGSFEREELPSRRRIPPFPAEIRSGRLLREARMRAIDAAALPHVANAQPRAAKAARRLGEADGVAVHGGVVMQIASNRDEPSLSRRTRAPQCE